MPKCSGIFVIEKVIYVCLCLPEFFFENNRVQFFVTWCTLVTRVIEITCFH